eukprot:TRINITY_DN69187_c0_g1_i1.p1 TRINITY_DN69187_c0_g1~~TRINITY_DN69187_c0_g1_i1.p1  ORF type:complete len:315 (-),score=40.84 TRINITY_DN69187_c0_g1_i1:132-1076(-)
MGDSEEAVNIFTINNGAVPNGHDEGTSYFDLTSLAGPRGLGLELQDLLSQQLPWLRTGVDPVAELQRQAHLQRRKVVCLLNDMDQSVRVIHAELQLAAKAMCRFGETHSPNCGPSDITTFIQDSMHFIKEAVMPEKIETKLSDLEYTADCFRTTQTSGHDEMQLGSDVQKACSDLQVDIAVLLESALMTAQQALAEYRRLLCKLQVLVTECEPIYRHAISDPTEPTALLRVDLRDKVEEESLPAPEVKWVREIAELSGPTSRLLAATVRELGRRAGLLRDCAEDLRTMLVHGVALHQKCWQGDNGSDSHGSSDR